MSDEANSKRAGKILIVGGIVIAAITLGGFFISQNANIFADMKRKSDLARKGEMMTQLLVAPKSCTGLDTLFFMQSCAKLEGLEDEEAYDNLDWREGLSAQQQVCLFDTFNQVETYKLKYEGRSLKLLKNTQDDIRIVTRACGVSSDLEFFNPDHNSEDAEIMINAWYQVKLEQGNDFP